MISNHTPSGGRKKKKLLDIFSPRKTVKGWKVAANDASIPPNAANNVSQTPVINPPTNFTGSFAPDLSISTSAKSEVPRVNPDKSPFFS